MPSANKKNVSVVICCYNSALRLPETLRHLALQEVPEGFGWEVIVVDNNSTDDAATVAVALWQAYGAPAPMRVIEESKPGLSFARKKGVMESNGEIVVFCDDDNWLFPDYLARSAQLLEDMPDIGIIGGLGIPRYEMQPESWFLENDLERGLATGKLAEESGDLTETKKYVFGAGMVIRKNLFTEVARIKPYLEDRKGKALTSGGDVEMCFRAILAGYRVWYEATLRFYHYIPGERCTLDYQKKLAYGKGYSAAFLHLYKIILNKHPYLTQSWVGPRLLYNRLKTLFNLVLLNSAEKNKIAYQIRKAWYWGNLKGLFHLLLKFDENLRQIQKVQWTDNRLEHCSL